MTRAKESVASAVPGIVAIFAMVTLALLAIGVNASDAVARSCPDVMFIGARGSGEPMQKKENGKLVTVFHGVGRPIDYMAGLLGKAVGDDQEEMHILPVIYRADSVDELVPTKSELFEMAAGGAAAIYYTRNLKPYMDSIDQGVSQTIAEVRATLDGCPDAEIVLAGYSQGAMAVHQAELQLEREGDEEALDAIGGTLLLGDGDRTPNTAAKIIGDAPGGGEGVRVYLHGVKPTDVVEPETTAEICVKGDIVCDFRLHDDPGALTWYKEAAHIHSSYVDEPQRVYLRKAVAWLSEEMGLTG
jgi:hypothetical protein